MSARRRDLEGSLGVGLTADLGEVAAGGVATVLRRAGGGGRRDVALPGEMCDGVLE